MNLLLVSALIAEKRRLFLESPAEIAAEVWDEILELEKEGGDGN
jgi:hypothetical protein